MATVWLETGLSLQFAAEQVAMTLARRDAIVPWFAPVALALLGEADTVDDVLLWARSSRRSMPLQAR